MNNEFMTVRDGSLGPYLTKAFQGSDATALATFVNQFFRAAIALGAMLAVLQLVRAGLMYMTSDVWSDKSRATQIMQNAVMGLLILLAIWLILNQINPQILDLDILQRIQSSPATTK